MLSLWRHYLSKATCRIRPQSFSMASLVYSGKLKLLHYPPVLKNTYVRQVVLDKWSPLTIVIVSGIADVSLLWLGLTSSSFRVLICSPSELLPSCVGFLSNTVVIHIYTWGPPCALACIFRLALRSVFELRTLPYIRGNHLSNTTCLTQVVFKRDESYDIMMIRDTANYA